ncbi:MAG: hypothetical protein SPI97_06390 [Oscillospiraceae bacterium]|nr:hypothetical protein [Oscillospiraceae bacterium]
MNDKKSIRLTFYIVCALLLGAPYIWKLIKLVPELLETLPNAAQVLSAAGYSIVVIASIAVAYKLGEALWIRIVSIYSMIGLIVGVLTMMTRALGGGEVFEVLFELVCAPFYGIDSPVAVSLLMLILTITSYAFLNKMPKNTSGENKSA